ncbi:hypothetical protein A8O14_03070 [Polynucleobacter wuianus]|uniref:DUF3047 domain-containing protein n=1 Tax=Polynucleobacter wuianus TaxID=1743168 RepID=A0A191UE47_9BURK|nr:MULTISPECIES: DUF3047 domain-containing protein [Polynucleobacter]ANI99165.1 hypothetical protein A8O14_03070 [Polynucleobacter wuianus]MBU3552257.1 DUF3047 domain-containing protein [Polynucleobacter sp. MWH-Post4-6-1]MBU3609027.1 DUF3047 domain-containing protein [Polynucleobacter wuianus]
MLKSVFFSLFISIVFALTGCAGLGGGSVQNESGQTFNVDQMPAQEELPKFSAETARDGMPNGWNFYRIAPYKKNTVYRLENYQGKTVLSANSKTSASGLAVKLRPRQVSNLWLQWEWKALDALPEADNAEGVRDDAPLRILVAFDGNKSKLPLKEKMTFEMANLISGQEMPYATLMYIWSGKSPVDTIITNAHTSRIKMIVVDSGWDNLGQWHKHQRDLAADYKRAYGEAPGELIGIALLTDTDNTKSETRALYGDIELVRKNSK